MPGKYKSGFSLIEVLIALAVVALAATVVVPQLWKRSPDKARAQFLSQLNRLTHSAWQRAIRTQQVHKVFFDMEKKRVSVQEDTGKKETDGTPLFKPVRETYLTQSVAWPSHLIIKQFFIEGSDMMHAFVGKKTDTIWFFIVPDGLAQAVTMTLVDMHDMQQKNKPAQITVTLNPFWAEFKEHDRKKK